MLLPTQRDVLAFSDLFQLDAGARGVAHRESVAVTSDEAAMACLHLAKAERSVADLRCQDWWLMGLSSSNPGFRVLTGKSCHVRLVVAALQSCVPHWLPRALDARSELHSSIWKDK